MGCEAGTLRGIQQDDSKATLAPILKREDGLVDFRRTAMEIYNRWRGFQPWPGAYVLLGGKKLALHRMMPTEVSPPLAPGEIKLQSGRLFRQDAASEPLWNWSKCRWKARSGCRQPTSFADMHSSPATGWGKHASCAGPLRGLRDPAQDGVQVPVTVTNCCTQARLQALSPQDRNLCTTLVMGTLRWQIALDAEIRTYLKRPGEKLDGRVQLALRLGAFQLIHLDRVPAHAAISESVELAKSAGNAYAAGMVNAVLRNISRAGVHRAPENFQSPAEMAEVLGHPPWLVERWIEAYGAARAEQICRFDQELPQTHIRLLSPDAEQALREEGVELAPGSFLAQARRVTPRRCNCNGYVCWRQDAHPG